MSAKSNLAELGVGLFFVKQVYGDKLSLTIS